MRTMCRRREPTLTRELIAAERKFIHVLLRDGKITDEIRRRIERDLDLEEASLANREYRKATAVRGEDGIISRCKSPRSLLIVIRMTRQGLEILLERVSTWPEEAQEELVRSVASIESKHLGLYRLSDAERKAVRRGLAEMREGKLASDGAVEAVFNRYRA
jgi:hypothetical protein